MLKVQNLAGSYGAQPIVQGISLQVEKGRMLGILGPNGSGKSTLLKLMTGVMKPEQGSITLDGQSLSSYNAKDLAKKMAVLPQLHASAFSNTVRETVSLGRYPHQSGFFSSWSKEDEQAVQIAMEQTGITRYANQALEFLSGGEQQRVFIAQALAQQAAILLLDEPTNHLDIAHQKQILDMLRHEVSANNLTVISIFHDINLASLYCDELLLMENGAVKFYGAPHEVVVKERVEEVYEAQVLTYAHPEIAKPQLMILPNVKQSPPVFFSTEQIIQTTDYIQWQSPTPLKVVSSAVHNAGMGWYTTLLNRAVDAYYQFADVEQETLQFLQQHAFQPTNTVVMMTAVPTDFVAMGQYTFEGGSLIVVVTAGVGNALDVTKTHERNEPPHVGTINTWVIVDAKLTDEAFYQAMITATEAKTKALYEADIRDRHTQTIATGTATDSLLIGATQHGTAVRYAGPITDVGKVIGKAVFEMTTEAIQNYQKGRKI